MSNLSVAVLRGGPSAEHDVSMRTGQSVLESLRKLNYRSKDVVVTRGGDWLVDGYEKTPASALVDTDVAFLALHGSFGEDGGVQRLLDRFSIPYTGSGAYASGLAMNKVLTKKALVPHSVKTPPHLTINTAHTDINRFVYNLNDLFGPDYVVKPISGGSSIDTYIVSGSVALAKLLRSLSQTYESILVEKLIKGREATVGVVNRLRNQSVYVLPPVEIIKPATADFFDYESKYNGETDEVCPSNFSKPVKQELESIATLVHQALNLNQYSRSDFIVANDGIYFLEVNTLPGLTTESLLPKALGAVGITFDQFIEHLLTDAVNS